MLNLVLIGMGSTATAVAAAWFLDRLLDFDQLAARPDDDHGAAEG